MLGNTIDVMFRRKDRLHDWVAEQSRACDGKPWVLSVVGRSTALIVTSIEACNDVLRTQFDTFGWVNTVDHGILSANTGTSEQQRCAVARFFSTKTLREDINGIVMEKTERVCALLEICAANGRDVSMNELLSKFTTDVFAMVAFGVDLHRIDSMHCVAGSVMMAEHPLVEALNASQALTTSSMWVWKLQRWLNGGAKGRLKPCAEIMSDWMRMAILERVEEKQKQPPRRDLLSAIIQSGGSNDVQVVCDGMLNLFLASSISIGVAMCWLLVHVGRHPRVLHKIRAEMRDHLPTLGTCVPTMDEVARLPYLEATIKESLRLCMGVVCRSANKSTTLSDGTFIPLGSQVMIPLYATARMTSMWGPDAEAFRPERFIDEDTGGLKVLSPFACLSFVGQCAGRRFAMLGMQTLVAAMLSRFDVDVVEDAVPVQSSFSLMLPVKGGVMVYVRAASDSES